MISSDLSDHGGWANSSEILAAVSDMSGSFFAYVPKVRIPEVSANLMGIVGRMAGLSSCEPVAYFLVFLYLDSVWFGVCCHCLQTMNRLAGIEIDVVIVMTLICGSQIHGDGEDRLIWVRWTSMLSCCNII